VFVLQVYSHLDFSYSEKSRKDVGAGPDMHQWFRFLRAPNMNTIEEVRLTAI